MSLELAASAYEADGNTPEAVRVLRQAILSDPHNVNLYVDFANISLDHQSYQVGVDMINAGLAAEPKAAPLYVARGILYVQLAQYDKAEADFEKADALDPRESIGSAAEGLAAVQQNDPDHALSTVRAKLAKTPNDAFLLYLQGGDSDATRPGTGQRGISRSYGVREEGDFAAPSFSGCPRCPGETLFASGTERSRHRAKPQSFEQRPQGPDRGLSFDSGAAQKRANRETSGLAQAIGRPPIWKARRRRPNTIDTSWWKTKSPRPWRNQP